MLRVRRYCFLLLFSSKLGGRLLLSYCFGAHNMGGQEKGREGKGMGICISESPRLGSAVFFLFHLLVFFLSVECGMIADEGCNDE